MSLSLCLSTELLTIRLSLCAPVRLREFRLHQYRAVQRPAGGPRLGAGPSQAGGSIGPRRRQRGRKDLLPGLCQPGKPAIMSNKRSNSFRRAILQGGRQLKGAGALGEEVGLGLSQRLVRHIAYETLPREIDRKWYFDSYTCCPPPWLILAITIAEITLSFNFCLSFFSSNLASTLHRDKPLKSVAVFMYYGLQLDRWVLQVSSPHFLRGPLPYHPQLRIQAWRYLSYAFMHAGWVPSQMASPPLGRADQTVPIYTLAYYLVYGHVLTMHANAKYEYWDSLISPPQGWTGHLAFWANVRWAGPFLAQCACLTLVFAQNYHYLDNDGGPQARINLSSVFEMLGPISGLPLALLKS
ncbi:unnamed protein product [Oncorhynchus mykiss]|uniref:rhomboid protease n=1 Tax=Oncorhynchus mykiss TaxID=8022 RepID=A0A060YXF9_ONCMY|nr:unnamed protein product [Oncorhynchus mykiss]